MDFLMKSVENNIATVTLNRGKVNAISEAMTDEFLACLSDMAADDGIKALILTGRDRFFSFGLDIPEFLNYSKPEFIRFVTKFADLYTQLFLFPKPVIAALNGHTIAGGCMLASACDYRIMVTGKSKISLNEINFGSSLFPGSAEMLQYCVGHRNAELVAYTGGMFSAEEASKLGLVDLTATEEDLPAQAVKTAKEFAARFGPAFSSIKMLLRDETGQKMRAKDKQYRDEMVDIWYSESTWKQLQNIRIH